MQGSNISKYLSEFLNVLGSRHQLSTYDHFKEAEKFKESVTKDLAKRIEKALQKTDYRSLEDIEQLFDDITKCLPAKYEKLRKTEPISFQKIIMEQSQHNEKIAELYSEAYGGTVALLALPSSPSEDMLKDLLPRDPKLREILLNDPVLGEILTDKARIQKYLMDDTRLEFMLVLSSYERWLAKGHRVIAIYLGRVRTSRKPATVILTPVFRTQRAIFLAMLRKLEVVFSLEELGEEELELLLNYVYSDLDTLIHAVQTLDYRLLEREEMVHAQEIVAKLWG